MATQNVSGTDDDNNGWWCENTCEKNPTILNKISCGTRTMQRHSNAHKSSTSILDGYYERAIMYYHTALRNVGLFASLGLATLVCSYQFIGTMSSTVDLKQSMMRKLFSLLTLLTSAGFLTVSMLLVRQIVKNINIELRKHYGQQHTNQWTSVLHLITACHIVLYCVIIGMFVVFFIK